MLQRLFKSPTVPVLWTLTIQVLLCLPGSAIPQRSWMDGIPIDKMVHIILFGGFVVTWAAFLGKKVHEEQRAKLFLLLAILSSLNGIILEYVQKYYIPNRSFDVYDILADITGAFIGFFISYKYFLKSRSN